MNTIGHNFRITIYGESHGSNIGVIIDGCPPGLNISLVEIANDLAKRRPGAKATTSRIENDEFQVISGIFQGYSTGAPINIMIPNVNIKPKDYDYLKNTPRPGHSDYPAMIKFKGFNDMRGGGIFSGRLTAGIVAAGTIAKSLIKPIFIEAKVIEVGGETFWDEILNQVIDEKDSIGGLIECKAQNLPIGLGEPIFSSVESTISRLIFSIPGIKGIEFGAGFRASKMKGSEFNDTIIDSDGKTSTNNSGGINGGLTNGNELIYRVAIRPPSSIGKTQKTYNFSSKRIEELEIKGRHDSCIALRMPIIIESVTAICLADFQLTGGYFLL